MARYFLHVRYGDNFIEDPDGSELPDLDSARQEAVEGARVRGELKAGEVLDGQRIEITSEAGEVLATVRFKDVFRLLPEQG